VAASSWPFPLATNGTVDDVVPTTNDWMGTTTAGTDRTGNAGAAVAIAGAPAPRSTRAEVNDAAINEGKRM